MPFALRSPVCPLMDESAKMGRPSSSEAKPTMDPVRYSPPCSREKVEMTPYLPRSTSVRHSSANESFAAVDWCSLKATISGSRFSVDTALSALTSCARTTRRDLPPARAVDRAARAAWEARAEREGRGDEPRGERHMEDARGRMDARDVSIHRWRRDVCPSALRGFSNSRAPGDRRAGEGAERARGSGSSARRWPESEQRRDVRAEVWGRHVADDAERARGGAALGEGTPISAGHDVTVAPRPDGSWVVQPREGRSAATHPPRVGPPKDADGLFLPLVDALDHGPGNECVSHDPAFAAWRDNLRVRAAAVYRAAPRVDDTADRDVEKTAAARRRGSSAPTHDLSQIPRRRKPRSGVTRHRRDGRRRRRTRTAPRADAQLERRRAPSTRHLRRPNRGRGRDGGDGSHALGGPAAGPFDSFDKSLGPEPYPRGDAQEDGGGIHPGASHGASIRRHERRRVGMGRALRSNRRQDAAMHGAAVAHRQRRAPFRLGSRATARCLRAVAGGGGCGEPRTAPGVHPRRQRRGGGRQLLSEHGQGG